MYVTLFLWGKYSVWFIIITVQLIQPSDLWKQKHYWLFFTLLYPLVYKCYRKSSKLFFIWTTLGFLWIRVLSTHVEKQNSETEIVNHFHLLYLFDHSWCIIMKVIDIEDQGNSFTSSIVILCLFMHYFQMMITKSKNKTTFMDFIQLILSIFLKILGPSIKKQTSKVSISQVLNVYQNRKTRMWIIIMLYELLD